MVIGACGFTSTGSSAVSDYLKEFTSVSTLDSFEFSITHGPDGIEDLDYQINEHCAKYGSSYVAIERFRSYIYNYCIKNITDSALKAQVISITEEYIDSITQVKWVGYGAVDYQLRGFNHYKTPMLNMLPYKLVHKIVSVLSSVSKKQLLIYPAHNMEFAMMNDEFVCITKLFINRLLQAYNVDMKKKVVLDQPFCAVNPYRSFPYFDDPIAIIVDRDPRDLFLATKKYARIKGDGYQIPVDEVKDFVFYYKQMRKAMLINLDNHNYEKVLLIRLEDLIYRYDEMKNTINDFCGLKEDDRVKHYFDPSISIANTQLFRKHPEERDNIAYIEENLKDYLYDFTPYKNITISGKVFLNKSPLNN